MHGSFTTSRKRPGYAAEEMHCARYLRSLHEGGVAVLCNRDHLTSGRSETWREWSSLELQAEKAESAQEDHRRDLLQNVGSVRY